MKGQKVNIAGLVSAVRHGISKKGTGYGFFTMQDFTGSLEFPLFSGDYEKYKHLMQEGQVVFLEGQFRQKYNSDEYQLKVTSIKMLETIGKEMTESVTLQLPLETLDQQLIDDIEHLCKNHKGKHKLKMCLVDNNNKVSLNLKSDERKVNADSDFISGLTQLGVRYKINA